MRFAVICRDLSSPTRQQTAATDDMLDTVHFIGMPSEGVLISHSSEIKDKLHLLQQQEPS